ncbi:MAG: biopolymer transporter ExbD [Deltaproteobacteria bacterium]|nr:biopolymer transporter ExbD [Deltaproteobacteria bacterium]
MASHVGAEDDEISAINVTPLVDVVLVLLVIFMITAPALYQNALKVQLPQAQSGEDQSKSTMQIVLDATGIITLQSKKVTLDELSAQIKTTHPRSSIIVADKKVEHGKVISIMDVLKANGVQKISFGVEKNN